MKVKNRVRAEDMTDSLSLMSYWAQRGWPVIPLYEVINPGSAAPICSCDKGADCDSPGKHPRTANGVKDATTDPTRIQGWAKLWPTANVGGSCVGRLVIDVDPRSGGAWPDGLPSTKRHMSGRGDGGGHLIFKLSSEQQASGVHSGSNVLSEGVDVKTGPNSYIVLPGSVHQTGGRYIETDDVVVLAPDELVAKVNETARATTSSETSTVRSMLTSLLTNPASEGGRNVWLTKVAGHHARSYRRMPDVFEQMVRDANTKMDPPLDEAEVDKIIESVWNTELQGHPERNIRDEADESNGFLISGDYSILTPVQYGEGPPVAAEWGDFDIRVQGRIVAPDHSQLFDVLLMRKLDRVEIPQVIESKMFGDARSLNKWLASFGVSYEEPSNSVSKMANNVRLLRYLMAQDAPQVQMAQHLGWNEDEGFITADGVITSSGVQSFTSTRPDPTLVNTGSCPFVYGTRGDRSRAADLLRRILTFQEDHVCAVYGSWWAASLIKPMILRHTSMFPVMAVEAASGSGKTNGFFSMLNRLGGNIHGEGNYSAPSLRNALSTNNGGVIWVDDLDDPRRVHELIRLLTSGSAMSKMGEDHKTTVTYQLVASLVLSGEALAVDGQKAMIERSVILRPDNPTSRTSQIEGREGESQWDDVLELQDEADEIGPHGLADIAGWVIANLAAMNQEGKIERIIKSQVKRKDDLIGRLAEKATVLRIGSQVLAELTGQNKWPGLVDEWIRDNITQTFVGDNALTMEVIPWALSTYQWPEDARAMGGGRPAFIDEDEIVWFSPTRLAQVRLEKMGKLTERTETANALIEQARQMGLGGKENRRQFRTGQDTDQSKRWYWPCTPEISKIVVERSKE